jgi:hypothetical protein
MKVSGKLLALAMVTFSCVPAFPQDSDDSTEAALAATIAAERAKKRNYPGGHDDQDLTVQAALPQPVRAPEAQSQVSTSEEAPQD